jgi:hypothetical protein
VICLLSSLCNLSSFVECLVFVGKMLTTAKLLGVHVFCFDLRHQKFYPACGSKSIIKVVTICRLVFEHGLPFDRVVHLSSNEKAASLLDAALQRTTVDLTVVDDGDGISPLHVSHFSVCLSISFHLH